MMTAKLYSHDPSKQSYEFSTPQQTRLTAPLARCKIHMYTNNNMNRADVVKRSGPYGIFGRETNTSLCPAGAWRA